MFYNPAMAADRDLAVAFARARFRARNARAWEMLAATGVRGLRLLHESGGFATLRATEGNPAAFAFLRENASAYPGASVELADAREAPADAPFDYVDLDPYGSPLPFLATAVGAVRDGGVIAVTATDLMVLAGVQPGACERRYGARPVRGRLGPEGGLRILLAAVDAAARNVDRHLEVLLAYVRGHHLRLYAELRRGVVRSDGREPVGRIDPASWDGPPLGAGGPFGPMWLGGLSDPALVRAMTLPPEPASPREVAPFLERLRGEAGIDRAFYYESNVLAGRLGLRSPPPLRALVLALSQQGYRTAPTHARPEGFRTEAPRAVVEATAERVARA